MIRINNEKTYLDKVDGNVVAIMTETFVYYTFNDIAGAIMEDISKSVDMKTLEERLSIKFADNDIHSKLESMINELIDVGMITIDDNLSDYKGELSIDKLDGNNKFVLNIEHYNDVAEYFAADPIHEVDLEKGWPYKKND